MGDVLRWVCTIQTEAYLVGVLPPHNSVLKSSSSKPPIWDGFLSISHWKAELCFQNGSLLNLPYAKNNLPYLFMDLDWHPVVSITHQDQAILLQWRHCQHVCCRGDKSESHRSHSKSKYASPVVLHQKMVTCSPISQ
jgi:hypothetical protein